TREPFPSGLEAPTQGQARGLKQHGHDETVFAAAGRDPELGVNQLKPVQAPISADARADVSMPADWWLEEHHAYLQLMIDLAEKGSTTFDVIHNNCLHYLPVAMARLLRVRMICTLHTPPTPWLESAIKTGPCPVVFAAVSRHTAL